MRKALVELKEMRAKLKQAEAAKHEPIAIVGIGCRFPQADSPDAFWQLLTEGRDAIREVPNDRWSADKYYDPNPEAVGKIVTRDGGFLDHVDQFDAPFFGISPREAEGLDPQHRLLLEVSWEALERAGIVPEQLAKSKTGVFAGICSNDYATKLMNRPAEQIDAYVATGTAHSTATGRLSYLLGLQGPSIALDTACSSSSVAVHLAVNSLRQGECDMALAGGTHLILSPDYSINFSRARMLSPDGRCKTFDTAANGYVRGEGCGIVVLKRLSDAQRDGDSIVALIRGSAVNQDGRTNGLTAPNGLSQQAVIREALADAKLSASEVGYIEAHGTGTPLGDPIEVNALGAVFGATREHPLLVGAVKTNIGHLEATAGIAGLIKAALMVYHGEIPAHLHFNEPSPHIEWAEMSIEVPTEHKTWRDGQRVAGASSFGFSGTNAHIIVSAPPEIISETVDVPLHWLALSAKSDKALQALAQRYADFLRENPQTQLVDICHNAYHNRTHFEQRLAISGASHDEMAAQLEAFANADIDNPLFDAVVTGKEAATSAPSAFLFTGQGSQYVGMGRQLYEMQPVFRETLVHCAEILRPHLDRPLLDVLFQDTDGLLNQTAYTQPALFAIEYALVALWQSWGIRPDIVMGHSVGEYVAACVAGVFSLEDGLKLIAARARLMQALPSGGEMVSVLANEAQVTQSIAPYANQLSIAAINGLNSIVISGVGAAVQAVTADLKAQGVKTRSLRVSHAFHSPLMEPMLAQFKRVAQQVTYHKPTITFVSNLTGKVLEATSADYWTNHIRQPVRFAAGVATLNELGAKQWIEIGAKPTLLGMARGSATDGVTSLPSLRGGQTEDLRQMWDSLSRLYVQGIAVQPTLPAGRRIALPTYPFQRQRHWIDTPEQENKLVLGDVTELATNLAQSGRFSPEQLALIPDLLAAISAEYQKQQTTANLKQWLYKTTWQAAPIATKTPTTVDWLIVTNQQNELGEQLATELRRQGNNARLTDMAGFTSVSDSENILYLPSANSTNCVPEAALNNATDLLTLVQQLEGQANLWVVTQGQPLREADVAESPTQLPLWGMGAVISAEAPTLWGGLIDLPQSPETVDLATLVQTLTMPDGENQIVIRQGSRYVARLAAADAPSGQGGAFSAENAYLITGGLGGLGLQAAQQLATQISGCHLILMGRSRPSLEAQKTIAKLEQQGAHVYVVQADVSNAEDVTRVFAGADRPIGGIIHAAGVLDDASLHNQNRARFERVFAPKVLGSWHLHQHSQHQPLAFFVCYSSASVLLGTPGQANYSAANAFMDGLARYRRALGLPMLSINWGAWAEVGMAAEKTGIPQFSPAQGGQILGSLLSTQGQIGALPIDWGAFGERFETIPPLLSNLITRTTPQKPDIPIDQQLAAADSADHHELVLAYLRQRVARTLRFDPTELGAETAFIYLGLDSLMAVEIRDRIRTDLNVEIDIVSLLEGSSLTSLTNMILMHHEEPIAVVEAEEIEWMEGEL